MIDSIAILLSTYNGELYLKDQVESIIKQNYRNWNLYIRDDGSKDSTVDIIKYFVQTYSNIHFVEDNQNKGAALSFLYLLEVVEADYYMFCDQDDIWLHNKIDSVLQILKNNENKNPFLVFSDAKVVDQNLNIISNSFWKYNKTPPSLIVKNPYYISVFNCAPGCTMIFNKELKKKLYDYDDNIIMHDWYIMIKALQNGIVKYSEEPLILYRQHQNNTLGADEISYKNRVKKIIDFSDTLENQIRVFRFVKKYVGINFFQFYILKIKFNFYRFLK